MDPLNLEPELYPDPPAGLAPELNPDPAGLVPGLNPDPELPGFVMDSFGIKSGMLGLEPELNPEPPVVESLG